jgi:Sortase domain
VGGDGAAPPRVDGDAPTADLTARAGPDGVAPDALSSGPASAAGYVVERRPSPAHRAVPKIGGVHPLAALVIAVGLGLAALAIAVTGHGRPPVAPASAPVGASAVPTEGTTAVTPGASAVAASTTPVPVGLRATEVRLPTLDVRSTLVDLDVGPDGALAAPPDPAVAGWYVHGSVPGAPGPTVIAGHVDSRTGPAVFYRLDQLSPGDRVEVTRSDGQVFAYRVATVGRYPKDAFPTDRVYGPTPGPELRLITCGGDFDRRAGHYRDNVVVTAIPAP